MPASRVLAVSPIEQVERYGDPRKVTGSLDQAACREAGACRQANRRHHHGAGPRVGALVTALNEVWTRLTPAPRRLIQKVRRQRPCDSLSSAEWARENAGLWRCCFEGTAARIGTRVRGWRDKEIDRELRREAQEERIDKADKRAGLRNLACGARVPAAHRSLPATCMHIRRAAT
jgi:hypothetical protein